MKKLTTLPCGNEQDDFTKRALPFQKRFYRTALILTKSPLGAEQLLLMTSSYAKEKYCQFNPHTNFGVWLSQRLLAEHLERRINKSDIS